MCSRSVPVPVSCFPPVPSPIGAPKSPAALRETPIPKGGAGIRDRRRCRRGDDFDAFVFAFPTPGKTPYAATVSDLSWVNISLGEDDREPWFDPRGEVLNDSGLDPVVLTCGKENRPPRVWSAKAVFFNPLSRSGTTETECCPRVIDSSTTVIPCCFRPPALAALAAHTVSASRMVRRRKNRDSGPYSSSSLGEVCVRSVRVRTAATDSVR